MPTEQEYFQTPGHAVAVAVILPLLGSVALTLRFWVRTKQRQKLKMDDWLTIPALLLTWGISVAVIYGVSQHSVGYRTEVPPDWNGSPFDLKTRQITIIYKIQWAYGLMLPLALGCIKASFLFFYLRIFAVGKESGNFRLITGLIILVATWALAFFFAALFECRLNFWAIWGSTSDILMQCTLIEHIVLALCISDFITDLIIIVIPIPLIWRLNLSTGNKIAVSGVFLLGSITIVASLVRLILMVGIVQVGFDPNADGNLIVTEYLYWGIVETGIGVVAACLPTLQFLFRGWKWDSIVRSTKNLLKSGFSGSSYARTEDLSLKNASYYRDGGKHSSPGEVDWSDRAYSDAFALKPKHVRSLEVV
ncbi:plasma membrane protein Pth11-like protein [Xylaria arbuscula]|nr:plasma membrane protein Pth11-like protein [Xylaria arbuscula]